MYSLPVLLLFLKEILLKLTVLLIKKIFFFKNLGLLCFLAGIIVIEIIIKRVLIDLGGNC
jgi:hypothetical protein